MDIIAMKNINSFIVNHEARQEEFERNCMRAEEALTRLDEKAVDNVNLNATLRLARGMWETLNERHSRFITTTVDREIDLWKKIGSLEKALERAEEARWEIEEHYDIVERKLHQEINILKTVNTGMESAIDNLHTSIIKEKKEHINTKRITTRKINKLEKN